MEHRVLELYSGIGGMHIALKESRINGEVVAAVDINTIANEVYCHNFPATLRYYCIARKTASAWHFKRKEEIIGVLPKAFDEPYTLESIIEKDVPDTFALTNKLLKRGYIEPLANT
ncbi:unnamed protein product, partial [Iphiclides podalirius]